MNMDMAELQKIQTDPGTQFSDGQDTKFVTNTQSEKSRKAKIRNTLTLNKSLTEKWLHTWS